MLSLPFVVSALIYCSSVFAQTTPTVLIDGQAVQATTFSQSPYWLHSGQTLAIGNKVVSVSVLQFHIMPSAGTGKTLQFDSIINVTALQTVPVGKGWKIESVALDPTASSFNGDNLGSHVAATNLNMNNYEINNLSNPVNQSDAVNALTIQNGTLTYAQDIGSGNSYAVTLSPAPTSYVIGMVVNFIAASSNLTGGCTLNVNGLGAKSIKKQLNVDPVANDILSGMGVTVMYDGTNFQMLSQLGNVAVGSFSGVGMEVFSSSNPAWTVPAGVNSIVVEAWGGGGGGGGGGAYYVNSGGGGGGGGSGGYGKLMINGLTPGANIAVVVGAGGSGGAGGSQGATAPSGTAGGNSSVNGTIVAYGGGAGSGGTSGGNGYNGTGGNGGSAAGTISSGFSIGGSSGAKGSSPGSGGTGGAVVDYFQSKNYGKGGNGGNSGTSSSTPGTAGSAGNSGLVIIYY